MDFWHGVWGSFSSVPLLFQQSYGMHISFQYIFIHLQFGFDFIQFIQICAELYIDLFNLLCDLTMGPYFAGTACCATLCFGFPSNITNTNTISLVIYGIQWIFCVKGLAWL